MIEAGTPAPNFSLADQDGRTVTLADLRGQRTLLVFYPLDFSPVCTDQLNVYDEMLSEFSRAGVEIYGVSVDSAFCHAAFRERLGLRFPLLADFEPKGALARAFGCYVDDRGHSQRALALIGPDLTVEWSHQSPSPLEIPSPNLVFDALAQSA